MVTDKKPEVKQEVYTRKFIGGVSADAPEAIQFANKVSFDLYIV